MKLSIKATVVGLCLAVSVTGCATVNSAYKSASETVSDWFKPDDKKRPEKVSYESAVTAYLHASRTVVRLCEDGGG